MKAVVTGGAGFIGSHLARALLDEGHEVHVVDDYSAGRLSNRIVEGVTYHEGSILNDELLDSVFVGADWIFHTAALPRVQFSIEHPRESNIVNIDGTVAVLEAARAAGVSKVVYSASSSAYGNQETLPLVESMTPQPLSPYALQKYVGERYCALFSELFALPTVCLRYFNVYGPGTDPHGAYALVVGKFIQQRSEGIPLTVAGEGTNTRDYTHVKDVVRANLLAAASPNVGAGEVLNIGGGGQWSVLQVAQMIGGEIVHEQARIEPSATRACIQKAKDLIGWEPHIRFEDGIAELKRAAGIS